MPSKRLRTTSTPQVAGGGSTEVVQAFTEAFSLNIQAAESNATPTDAASFNITANYSDSNAEQAEAVTLNFPEGNFADSSTAPVDTNNFTLRVWLSGSAGAGVTNPGNADSESNGANAVISTAALGASTETLTSQLGANLPAGVNVGSAIYRGWFSATVPLPSSTVEIIADYSEGAVTMLTTTAAVDHSTGTFTFDLVAAGINTIAELQSMTVRHQTTDAVAGVQPAILNVDAGAIELAGAFV